MAEKLDCQTSVLILGIFMAALQKSDNSIEQLPESAGTRERLLDAAETLFANNGFHGVSLRTITTQAGVNLAAAHYHFGSKKGLMREVFKRRLDPIHVESARLLEECLTKNGGKPDLGKVITAFLGPSLRMGNAENAATF